MDINRRNLALTGVLPLDSGPGTINAGPPAPRPELRTLQRRGRPGVTTNVQVANVPLDVAYTQDQPYRVGLAGNVLLVNDTFLATDKAQVRFDGRGNWVTVRQGWRSLGRSFSYLEFAFAAQPASYLEVLVDIDPNPTPVVYGAW